jgi:enoyl-CoA hydratase
MVLACDLIVASREARMGMPEVKRNLVAMGGGLLRLPHRIPYHIAAEVALTGALYPASFFHAHGMINRLCEPGFALSEAVALANTLLQSGPTALAATVSILRRAPGWSLDEGWAAQRPLAKRALEAADRAEGVRAFVEKRQPVWTGR